MVDNQNLNPAGGGARGDIQDRLPFMNQSKSRFEGQVQHLLSGNCQSHSVLSLFSTNGPEMRGKLTSSPATVGPSPEKVTFRQLFRGYFHAWGSYLRIYFQYWPAHIQTSPRDNFWPDQHRHENKFKLGNTVGVLSTCSKPSRVSVFATQLMTTVGLEVVPALDLIHVSSAKRTNF